MAKQITLLEADTLRKLEAVKNLKGLIPNTGDSVKEVRAIRRKLSKEPFDLRELNAL